jgi:hypothetical protein
VSIFFILFRYRPQMQFGIIMSKGLTYIAPSKKLGNDVGELIPSWACCRD